MARPTKEGLEYFPLDVDIDQDDKLIVPIGKFGMQGFGIIIKLMSKIYKNGYFYHWSEREQYVFTNQVNVDINLVNDIVNECIKWGFFNQDLFDLYQILTSKGFQNRYIGGSRRRKNITFIQEYELIDLEECCKRVLYPIYVVNVSGKRVNVYKNPDKCIDSDTVMPQIEKEKEIEREIKDNKKSKETSSRQRKTYAEDSSPYRMAVYLHEKIMGYAEGLGKAHLVKDANMQKWSDECRKILELDKRDRAEVLQVIHWTTTDSFWQGIILSPSNLRKHYQELCLKMAASAKKNKSGSTSNALAEKNKQEKEKIRELMERGGSGSKAVVLDNPQHI